MPQTSTISASDVELQTLVEKAKDGDEQALRELIKQFEPFVRGSALKVCEDSEKAAATTQDTLISVFRKLHQFEGESKFTTWLYRIVANHCLMNRRKRKLDAAKISLDQKSQSEQTPEILNRTSSDLSPIDELLQRELTQVLDSAIANLPTKYSAVFILRDVEHRTAQETADQLGLSIAAIKSRLHRARAMVREEIEKYLQD